MVKDLILPPGYRPQAQPDGTDGVTVFKRGKVTRHMEDNTMEELGFQVHPWLVRLRIERMSLDLTPVFQDYYVRAPGGAAAMMASKFWERWEKIDMKIGNYEYPDTLGDQSVQALTDKEYLELWKFAKDLPRGEYMQFEGPKNNPSVFTFWESGKPRHKGSNF